jgi:hypothetical protein
MVYSRSRIQPTHVICQSRDRLSESIPELCSLKFNYRNLEFDFQVRREHFVVIQRRYLLRHVNPETPGHDL